MLKKIFLSTFIMSGLAACGGGSGSGEKADGQAPNNAAPEATEVMITGNQGTDFVPSVVLTGSYNFTDVDGDLEGGTTFRWLRNDEVVGNKQSYTVQPTDVASSITFEVSPIASTGTLTGQAVTSSAITVMAANEAPIASAIIISDSNGGSTWAGDELVGQYTYSDAESDGEGATVLRWLVDGAEVATGSHYITSASEAGKSIVFEVTPRATKGALTGSPYKSIPFSIKKDLHFFTANTLERNNNLFVTDGTEAGTMNIGLMTPGAIGKPVKFGDKWYFAVFDTETSKMRLASTDGTSENTKIFSQGPEMVAPYTLTVFKDSLYFSGRDEIYGAELWVVGDAEDAYLFKDIDASPSGGAPANFTVVGDQMFFTAYLSYTGVELWVTNGDSSNAGTRMVKDFTGDSFSSRFGSFHSFKDKLYVVQGGRLWGSDGTAAGTSELDLARRSSSATNFVTLGNQFFFTDSSVGNNTSLWVSDGETTTPLHHSQDENTRHSINDIAVLNDKVYFISERALYESTGTSAQKVETSGSAVSISSSSYLTVLNEQLLFNATLSNEENNELFQFSEGSISQVKDITGNSNSGNPSQLLLLNGEVIFRADDRISGLELWKTDGSEEGTVLLKDVKSGSSGSSLSLDISVSGF